ncbi:MAG: type IV pilus secretin PilQ [bacterium]|nr:type IV pilus secretin PilQ [bacterium]
MSKQWKLTLGAVLAFALTVAAPWAEVDRSTQVDAAITDGPVANLTAVRVDDDSASGPVVQLDLGSPAEFEAFLVENPDRLVLDLQGVVSRLGQYRFPIERDGVLRVRAAQHVSEPVPVTRVVFDLEGPLAYDVERTGDSLRVAFGPAERAAAAPAVAVSEDDSLENVLNDLRARSAALLDEEGAGSADDAVSATYLETEPLPVDPERTRASGRSVEQDAIDHLFGAAPLASEHGSADPAIPASFETQQISGGGHSYTGKRISLNLVDADLKQVFRFFHEISGLNFVLDPEVTGTVTIVLDQVPWDQALDLILKNNGLDKVLENNVLRIATTQKLAREAAARKQLQEAEDLEVDPVTLTRTLSYAKAEDVERVVREGGILSPRGKVIVDVRTNTLIISDIPKRVEPLDALISVLDAETPQVMIEARIVETSRKFSQDLGVNWGFTAKADASTGTATGLGFPHNASVEYGLNLPGQEASQLAFSFGNVIDSFTLDLALNAQEEQGKSRILSSPRIATQNNERAEIEQGVRIPIVNTTATEIDVEFVSASLRLIVTPQITAEGTIILDIVVENNSPDFNSTAADIPSIRTQRAQTKVLINDGGTTVIGGIFSVTEGDSEIGVPWFRKLPLFGWLFRSQSTTRDNLELLIFVTPKIVKLS